MIEDVDFTYILPESDRTLVLVKLLTGKFAGTIFKYGKVKFNPDEMTRLQFAFDVLESTVDKPKKLQKDPELTKIVGDLLVEIILKDSNEDYIDEIGTDDTEVPGTLGGILPEGDTFS